MSGISATQAGSARERFNSGELSPEVYEQIRDRATDFANYFVRMSVVEQSPEMARQIFDASELASPNSVVAGYCLIELAGAGVWPPGRAERLARSQSRRLRRRINNPRWNRRYDQLNQAIARRYQPHVQAEKFKNLALVADQLRSGPIKMPKRDRTKPDHAITEWLDKHGHKYDNTKAGVEAFANLHGGNPAQLYTQWANDMKKRRKRG